MPIYEYLCEQCGKRSEVLQHLSNTPLTVCDACGGSLRKLVSAPSFQFKGSGWYVTDYAKGDKSAAGAAGKPDDKGESKAGSKGEAKRLVVDRRGEKLEWREFWRRCRASPPGCLFSPVVLPLPETHELDSRAAARPGLDLGAGAGLEPPSELAAGVFGLDHHVLPRSRALSGECPLSQRRSAGEAGRRSGPADSGAGACRPGAVLR